MPRSPCISPSPRLDSPSSCARTVLVVLVFSLIHPSMFVDEFQYTAWQICTLGEWCYVLSPWSKLSYRQTHLLLRRVYTHCATDAERLELMACAREVLEECPLGVTARAAWARIVQRRAHAQA